MRSPPARLNATALRVRSPRPPSPQVAHKVPQGPKIQERLPFPGALNRLPTVPAPVYDARLATHTRHALRDTLKTIWVCGGHPGAWGIFIFPWGLGPRDRCSIHRHGGLLVDCGLYQAKPKLKHCWLSGFLVQGVRVNGLGGKEDTGDQEREAHRAHSFVARSQKRLAGRVPRCAFACPAKTASQTQCVLKPNPS